MNKTPLISIIIPVYNNSEYLTKCLSSIKNQTYKNFEVIIVDDASTEDVATICGTIITSDARFSYLKNDENLGNYLTRIEGMKVAKGDYFCFFDSDDFIKYDFLEYHINIICKHKVDVVKSSFINLWEGKEEIVTLNLPQGINTMDADVLQRRWFWHTLWNGMYSKDCIEETLRLHKPYRVDNQGDFITSFFFFFKPRNIYISHYTGVYYRRLDNSINSIKSWTGEKGKKALKSYVQVASMIKEILDENDFDKQYREYYKAFINYDYIDLSNRLFLDNEDIENLEYTELLFYMFSRLRLIKKLEKIGEDKSKIIAEKNKTIAEKNKTIAEKNEKLELFEKKIVEYETKIRKLRSDKWHKFGQKSRLGKIKFILKIILSRAKF